MFAMLFKPETDTVQRPIDNKDKGPSYKSTSDRLIGGAVGHWEAHPLIPPRSNTGLISATSDVEL